MESMDLKQIRCFVAACEEGSFSKAAQREHCTQPGLSLHIQCLESMVAHRLFDRQARGVTPTTAGRHFYTCCVEILKAVARSKEQMLDLAGNVATEINIGIAPTIAAGVLPWMLPDYVADHPYVNVRLAEAYSGTLTEWVVSGEVEVAIVTNPPAHLGLETSHFFRDRLVLVSRPTGRPEERQVGLRRNASDLGKLNLILPSPRHSLRQVIDSSINLGVTGGGRILEIDGMNGTLELVRKSDWHAIVARTAVMDEVKQGRLVAEQIYGPELWLDFYLVKTKNAVLSVAYRDFLRQLKDTVRNLAGMQKLSSIA
jgi:LysR family transcriptional regulator, nitrogen assimilation regulatory protein